jgi:Fe-S oxidoreductase
MAKTSLRCIGVGACRKSDAGTMCPSYMATLEEAHSTRGRAHMLFEMLQGEVNGSLPVGLARHVEPGEDCLAAPGAHVRLHRPAFGFENIADYHARPFAGEEACLRRSHPERSAADESHLAFEPHGRSTHTDGFLPADPNA